MARRTSLHDRHVALGARMVEFAGWDMPIWYTGIREEHVAVRERAGLFDVSHMGEVILRGEEGMAAVRRLVANDAGRLEPGQSMYGVMCNEDGGIVDDVIVTRGTGHEHVIVVVNAATREKDVAWMRAQLGDAVPVEDVSDRIALLAVQGPKAVGIVQSLTDADVTSVRPFRRTGALLAGIDSFVSVVSRTGYTGEDGVEISFDADKAPALWDALLEAGGPAGLVPCGLGARDTLRLEAGLRLYGQDMDETVDPFSCGLGWTVKLDRDDFVGSEALRRLRDGGPPRTMLGLALEGRTIARHGSEVRVGGRRAGEVTSGAFSFTLGHGIATALVDREAAGAETVEVDVRGVGATARVVPLPFYRRPR